MGCAGSTESKGEDTTKKLRKPKPWKHPQPITRTELRQLRDEFWDTAPHYGGQKEQIIMSCKYRCICRKCNLLDEGTFKEHPLLKEIWDALHAAAEADLNLAQAIVDSAGVIIASADMTTCYDERGAKYELPKYILSEPTNLIRDS